MLTNAWYCAAWSRELGTSSMLRRKLLNLHVLIARDKQGHVHALRAVCPHRGADLSRGRLLENSIECPVHGWRFDMGGRCLEIPSQPPAAKIPPQACVSAYPAREQQGIIWLWLGRRSGALPDPPWHQELDTPLRARRRLCAPQLWQASFINVVENAIDLTHLPYVHGSVLGRRGRHAFFNAQPRIDNDLRGFSGEDSAQQPWDSFRLADVASGPLGRLASALLGIGTIQRERYRFNLGGSLLYKIEWQSGTWDAFIAHATPADDTHTWFFGMSVRTRAINPIGDLCQAWFDRKLCQDDRRQVSAMLSNDPNLLHDPISVVGDAPMLAFRRIYKHQMSLDKAR